MLSMLSYLNNNQKNNNIEKEEQKPCHVATILL